MAECEDNSGKPYYFLLNLVKTCSDITSKTCEYCPNINKRTKMRIKNLSDDVFLALLSEGPQLASEKV